MKLVPGSPKRVPFYAHPILWILTSALGLFSAFLAVQVTYLASQLQGPPLVGSTGQWLEFLFPVRAPWVSLLVGIAVGWITMLVEKRLLHSHVRFYADFVTMPILERLRWHVLRTNLLICLPLAIGPLLAAGVALAFRISPLPAFFSPFICSFLAYPEQKLIYEMAASRMTQKAQA